MLYGILNNTTYLPTFDALLVHCQNIFMSRKSFYSSNVVLGAKIGSYACIRCYITENIYIITRVSHIIYNNGNEQCIIITSDILQSLYRDELYYKVQNVHNIILYIIYFIIWRSYNFAVAVMRENRQYTRYIPSRTNKYFGCSRMVYLRRDNNN